jgi:hypothetical protein
MIITTRNKAASYSADAWITGAPIPTDSPPTNLASVPVGRRITIRSGIVMTPGTQISAFAADGSSTCVGRFWWYDLSNNLWVANGAGLTLTTGGTNVGNVIHGTMPGSLWFFQVTANAGGTTKIGILVR